MLAFCGVTGLRPSLCRSVMASNNQSGQGTNQSEPFFAVVEWASRPVQSNNTVSLLALDLLREVYEVCHSLIKTSGELLHFLLTMLCNEKF